MRLVRSISKADRRSSVKLVTLHTSVETFHSCSRSSEAAITSRRMVPEPSNWTQGLDATAGSGGERRLAKFPDVAGVFALTRIPVYEQAKDSAEVEVPSAISSTI